MYSVRWLKRAINDRDAIVLYLAQDCSNPKAAIDFGDLVEEKVDLIANTGTLFREGKVPRTREYVLTPTYIMVYQVRPKEKRVEILRILLAHRIK